MNETKYNPFRRFPSIYKRRSASSVDRRGDDKTLNLATPDICRDHRSKSFHSTPKDCSAMNKSHSRPNRTSVQPLKPMRYIAHFTVSVSLKKSSEWRLLIFFLIQNFTRSHIFVYIFSF